MKILSSGIAVILSLAIVSCSTFYKSVIDKRDQNYKEGVELYNKKKYEDARDCFKVVMDIEPGYKDTRKYWAILDSIIKKKENMALQRANGNYNKGLTLMKQAKYEDALYCFLQVKVDNPEHKTTDEKISACRSKLGPKLKETLKQAGRSYNLKQYIQAYNLYLKAVIFDPSSSEAAELKGKIEDKLDERCRGYRSSGKEFYSKKLYVKAQQQFELALKNNPWDGESKELLAKVNNQLNLENTYNNAIAEYNKADYFKARYSFMMISNMEPGYKATEQYLNKINSILTGQLGTICNNGVALYEKGNYQSAINEFDKVLIIDPDHAMAAEYRQRAQSKLDIQKSLKGGTE